MAVRVVLIQRALGDTDNVKRLSVAVLRKAMEANYDRLDEVLAGIEKHKKGETR